MVTRVRAAMVSIMMIVAGGVAGAVLWAPPAAAAPAPGGSFTGVSPARLLDTRSGFGAPVAGQVPAGSEIDLVVAGRGGIPATGVASVIVNVTVTETRGNGYVAGYPAGAPRPTVSNVNYRAGQTVANLSTVALGAGGSVTLFTSQATHLVVDVTGWYSTTATASDRAGLFHPLRAARIADSRYGAGFTTPGAGVARTLQVTGRGGVPASGVSAVILNITAVGPTAAGHVTVYPTGQAMPPTSTLNVVRGDVKANRTVVALGAGGQVSLYNHVGSTPLVVDVVGWFGDGTAAPGTGGAYFVSLAPVRVVDTRGPVGDPPGPLGAGEAQVQRLSGRFGVPSGAGTVFPVAVVGNVTAVSPTGPGYLTTFPPGFGIVTDSVPNASDLNFAAGDIVPNMIVTQLHGGDIGLYNSAGTTHVILDVSGYFALDVPALSLSTVVPGADDQVATGTMSGDSRYVAVTSHATNLVTGDTNGSADAFRKDRTTGTTRLVSVGTGGAAANDSTYEAAGSDNGRYVALVSLASNLVPGDTNNRPDVFVRDLVAGTTTRLSVGPGGVQANGDSYNVSISRDGARVAFVSSAANLVAGDTNSVADAFVVEVATRQVRRVSVGGGGAQVDQGTDYVGLSGDGGHALLLSAATTLVPGDTNQSDDVFVHTLATGVTSRESVASGGGQAVGAGAGEVTNQSASLSDDGNLVVFTSAATNLVGGDTDAAADVFIRNRAAGTTTRLAGPGGVQGPASDARISGDGSTIVFASEAPVYSPVWRDSYGATLYVYRPGTGAVTPVRGYGYFTVGGVEINTTGTAALVSSDVDGLAAGERADDIDLFLLSLP